MLTALFHDKSNYDNWTCHGNVVIGNVVIGNVVLRNVVIGKVAIVNVVINATMSLTIVVFLLRFIGKLRFSQTQI